MSRGYGKVQRLVLDSLARRRAGATVRELAGAVYWREPTESDMSAVRRAVRRLLTAGEIIESRDPRGSRVLRLRPSGGFAGARAAGRSR